MLSVFTSSNLAGGGIYLLLSIWGDTNVHAPLLSLDFEEDPPLVLPEDPVLGVFFTTALTD